MEGKKRRMSCRGPVGAAASQPKDMPGVSLL